MFGRFITLLLYFTCLRAAHPIVIDGLFDDWQEVPVTIMDSEGDYIVRCQAGHVMQTEKIILLK